MSLQTDRYAEYPKLKELVERKDGLIAARATPPFFLKVAQLSVTCTALAICLFAHNIMSRESRSLFVPFLCYRSMILSQALSLQDYVTLTAA